MSVQGSKMSEWVKFVLKPPLDFWRDVGITTLTTFTLEGGEITPFQVRNVSQIGTFEPTRRPFDHVSTTYSHALREQASDSESKSFEDKTPV